MGDKAAKVKRKYLKDLQKALRTIVQDQYKKRQSLSFWKWNTKKQVVAQDFYKESCELQIMFFQLQFNQKQLKTSQSRHGSNIFKHQGFFIKDFFK